MSKKGNRKNGFVLNVSTLMLAATIALSVASAPALAATTWMPEFNPNQSVYVDPSLKADSVAPVDLSALPPKLAAEAAKNNLKVFVVMAKKGDESLGDCKQKFAVCKLEELMGKWNARLPQDDYVLLLVVRSDTDWTKVSYAANLGNRPRGFGVGPNSLNLDKWAKGVDGGVAYLPRDPGNFALHVVADINALMDKAESEAAAKQAQAEFMAALPGYLMLGTGLAMAIALGVFLALRYRKERGTAFSAIETLESALDAANTNYMQIQGNYLDFLSEQGNDWKTKFQGQTLVSYTSAVAAYADLSARISAANELLDQAKKQFAAGNVLSVEGFREAYRLLTSEPVVVTGDSLPLNERSLFSSEVEEDSYSPDALLRNMDDLFQRTNNALSSIMESFGQAQTNSQEVGKISAEVRGLADKLAGQGVSSAPYNERLQAVLVATQKVQANLQKDPLAASSDSSRLRQSAQTIAADIKTALGLVEALASAEKSLTDAQAKVDTQRSKTVKYAYPGSDAPAQTANTYLLAEDGYNPDFYAKQARAALGKSHEALQGAKLAEAEESKKQAQQFIAEMTAVIASSLEAQSFVADTAASIIGTLNQLNQELPQAEAALATLKSDFLPVNYGQVEGYAAAALKLASNTVDHLAQVQRAYFEQRFMASAEQLKEVKGNIQSGRDGLLAIHSTLANLQQLRLSARDVSSQIQGRLSKLESRLQETAFTTAAKTEETFRTFSKQAGSLAQEVAADKADWVKCDRQAKELQTGLNQVAEAIENQLAAYNKAKAEFSQCERQFAQVESVVGDSRVRSSARQKLESARQAKAKVESALSVARSDWSSVNQSLILANQSIEAAQSAARQDIRMADEAARDIDNAESHIDGVPSSFSRSRSIGSSHKTFGQGISADTSSAQSSLRSAQSAYQRQDYEEASRLAERAKSQADEARDEAERQVQAQINAAVAAWEYAESQRRAAEEAERQRQATEDAQRRANESSYSSTSTSTFDTSSSGSFGGDSGGGSGSFGGGDF
ncbi:MAG: hypothetical protein HY986_07850 [Candidatus Melainabacteria bacterium]|nr:hypothetical protein [Candidatus Melainabacteria bacterium]